MGNYFVRNGSIPTVMGITPRNFGAVLWSNNMVIFFLGVFLLSCTGGAATDTSDYFGSMSSLDLGSLSCNFTTLSSMRSTWRDGGELCRQKLPFEFWIYMKAEGSAEDPDADHVMNECLLPRAIGVVELVTPEDWNTTIMDAAPGQLLRETKRAASYLVESPLDFEAVCTDEQVTKVSRINVFTVKTHGFPLRKSGRHLQNTVSEGGTAHGVDALISGLEELGCQRTTGEDQTLCIMSDSFNNLGGQLALQESGDLPPDEFLTIVEELPEFLGPRFDEGSAMMELAYDISSGANFKFNTMWEGTMMASDDIIKLATDEACDVIVDDINFGDQPGFRDGIVSDAVDEVVASDILYFSSAGNNRNGYKFTSNWECTSVLFGDVTLEPCGSGFASHVFHPDLTGIERYALVLDQARFSSLGDVFLLHWDDDESTSRDITFAIWTLDVTTGTYTPVIALSDFGTAVAFLEGPVVGPQTIPFLTISQAYTDLEDVEMRVMSRTYEIFSDFSDGSIHGHPCATSAISVAALDILDISGGGNAFADPEMGSVANYSSWGPCYINSGNGIEERLKPVTTAATGLQTSTNPGTSASAPVAAAIATIVRAACFPRVVTYSDMMEMLTDYTYTIDVTSDAGGAEETWGTEAGYGIISADQMLEWIATNCQESCPGATTPSTPVPTPVPSSEPPTAPPTAPPIARPTLPPTLPPTPTPAVPHTAPPVARPAASPTLPPMTRPTSPPIVPPTTPPVAPPTPRTTTQPITVPTMPPLAPPTVSLTMPPTLPPMGGLVDASERTSITVTANAFDTRTTGFGCPPNGCEAANTRDGDLSSRWSCKEDLLGGTNCEITYLFEEPQDIVRMLIAFYRGDTRTRVLKVKVNGRVHSVIESSGVTDGFEDFELNTDETETITLEGLELRGEEWISITEITNTFEEPQDIVRMLIAFYKGNEMTRAQKIKLNGSVDSVIESSGETDEFEEFELNTHEIETVTLEGLELRGEELISILEVQFLVL